MGDMKSITFLFFDNYYCCKSYEVTDSQTLWCFSHCLCEATQNSDCACVCVCGHIAVGSLSVSLFYQLVLTSFLPKQSLIIVLLSFFLSIPSVLHSFQTFVFLFTLNIIEFLLSIVNAAINPLVLQYTMAHRLLLDCFLTCCCVSFSFCCRNVKLDFACAARKCCYLFKNGFLCYFSFSQKPHHIIFILTNIYI